MPSNASSSAICWTRSAHRLDAPRSLDNARPRGSPRAARTRRARRAGTCRPRRVGPAGRTATARVEGDRVHQSRRDCSIRTTTGLLQNRMGASCPEPQRVLRSSRGRATGERLRSTCQLARRRRRALSQRGPCALVSVASATWRGARPRLGRDGSGLLGRGEGNRPPACVGFPANCSCSCSDDESRLTSRSMVRPRRSRPYCGRHSGCDEARTDPRHRRPACSLLLLVPPDHRAVLSDGARHRSDLFNSEKGLRGHTGALRGRLR